MWVRVMNGLLIVQAYPCRLLCGVVLLTRPKAATVEQKLSFAD